MKRNEQGIRWTSKERYYLKKSTVKWFIRRLFKKCSIYEGFTVDKPTELTRQKKYLVIQNNNITKNGRLTVLK